MPIIPVTSNPSVPGSGAGPNQPSGIVHVGCVDVPGVVICGSAGADAIRRAGEFSYPSQVIVKGYVIATIPMVCVAIGKGPDSYIVVGPSPPYYVIHGDVLIGCPLTLVVGDARMTPKCEHFRLSGDVKSGMDLTGREFSHHAIVPCGWL